MLSRTPARPVATTAAGAVSGTSGTSRYGAVQVFRGIPYGVLGPGRSRFEPARAPAPWPGTRDCSEPGPTVPQNPDVFQEQMPGRPYDDVHGLNLNVWTPAADSARRPVMVWIHGGGNITGSNTDPLQDGARLAAFADVVVVSVNYRLGVFGFLWLDRPEDGGSIGNAAIHDLVDALHWVQREIASFGGDPDNVTIAGQSAGAALVGTLLGVPAAAGLFRRAIMQSGTAERVASPAEGAALTRELLGRFDLADADSTLLFDRSTADILAAQAELVRAHQAADVGLSITFRAVIDGTLIPEVPLTSIESGLNGSVDLLVGTNLDEASLFLAFDPPRALPGVMAGILQREIRRDLGRTASATVFHRAAEADLGHPLTDTGALEVYLTDRTYRQPSNRLLDARAGSTGRSYSYLFTRPSPSMQGRLGACHGAELPFVFGTLDLPEAAFFSGPDAPRSLSERMMSAWGEFARSGRPAPDDVWPAYDQPARSTLVLNDPASVVTAPHSALREFWASALVQTRR